MATCGNASQPGLAGPDHMAKQAAVNCRSGTLVPRDDRGDNTLGRLSMALPCCEPVEFTIPDPI